METAAIACDDKWNSLLCCKVFWLNWLVSYLSQWPQRAWKRKQMKERLVVFFRVFSSVLKIWIQIIKLCWFENWCLYFINCIVCCDTSVNLQQLTSLFFQDMSVVSIILLKFYLQHAVIIPCTYICKVSHWTDKLCIVLTNPSLLCLLF